MSAISFRMFMDSVSLSSPPAQREGRDDEMDDDFVLIPEATDHGGLGAQNFGPDAPPSYEMAISMVEPPPSYDASEANLPPKYSSLPSLPSPSYEQNAHADNSVYATTLCEDSCINSLPFETSRNLRTCDLIPFEFSRRFLARMGALGSIPILHELDLDQFQYDFTSERNYLRDTAGDDGQGVGHLADIEHYDSTWNQWFDHSTGNGTRDVLERNHSRDTAGEASQGVGHLVDIDQNDSTWNQWFDHSTENGTRHVLEFSGLG